MYRFELEEAEMILKKDLANLQSEENHLAGAFYLTTKRLVFVGYVIDATQKFMEEVTLAGIRELRPEKTFGILSNVIRIIRRNGTDIKILIKKRDEWLHEIQTQVGKLDEIK
jgi:hypothetical protein